MEGQDYLNQISANNRPMQKQQKGILSSKFFLVGAIGLGALIIIIIIGALVNGNKGGEKNLSFALKLHLDNTSSVIEEYQPNVKSSSLRSSSASLDSVISDTNSKLTDFVTAKYEFKEKDVDKKLKDAAARNQEELSNELFEAKINGVLDRVYAHKMSYETSMLMTEEAKLINSSKDDALKSILSTSYDSLKNLYDNFNNFSETK